MAGRRVSGSSKVRSSPYTRLSGKVCQDPHQRVVAISNITPPTKAGMYSLLGIPSSFCSMPRKEAVAVTDPMGV